jgi:fucose 4-O-acetylase-like acetyltransferase
VLFDLYNAIYFFHIPAFALVSGYLARPERSWPQLGTLATRLLIPYVVLQVLYTVYCVWFDGQALGWCQLVYPQFSLWYLLSLFFWHALLVPLSPLRPGHALAVAFCLGLGVTAIPAVGTLLSVSRTFVFLPFFVLGYEIAATGVQWPRIRGGRILAGALLGLLVIHVFVRMPVDVEDWLLGSSSNADLSAALGEGLALRALLYPVCLLMVLIFFALVPHRRLPVTRLGERTLYVFAFHGFALKLLGSTGWLRSWIARGHYWIFGVVTLGLITLLANKRATTLLSPLLEARPLRRLVTAPLAAMRGALAHGLSHQSAHDDPNAQSRNFDVSTESRLRRTAVR